MCSQREGVADLKAKTVDQHGFHHSSGQAVLPFQRLGERDGGVKRDFADEGIGAVHRLDLRQRTGIAHDGHGSEIGNL